MKKVLAILLALVMVLGFVACGKAAVDPAAKDEGVLTYDEYIAAEEGSDVTVEGFITGKVYAQAYGNCNLFLQDADGAYFVYRMPCEDADDAKLVIGQKIKVSGVKASWSGEVEFKEGSASYEIVDGKYEFESKDITALLPMDNLIDLQNMKVKVLGAVVKNAALYNWDGSGEPGSDLYLDITVNGKDYTFVVESDLCDKDSDCYKAVEGLKVGQTIDIDGFLYWYNGPQMWMTTVTAK